MKVKAMTLESENIDDIELSEAVFGLPIRQDILARMVRYQLAKRRAGTHKVKGRSEITATGAKMFRQKGTGNARHGNATVPQYRGGGRAFGPIVRSHAHDLPKKVRVLALKTALSAKLAEDSLLIIDDLAISEVKTSALKEKLQKMGIKNALFIDGETVDKNFSLAVRNLINHDVLPLQGINVYDILRRDKLVLSKAAVEGLEAHLG